MIENRVASLPPADRRIETRLQDGSLASGHLTFLSTFDYSLEIDSPWSGFKTGCHIPFFAGGYRRWWTSEGGMTEDCRKNAQYRLADLADTLSTMHSFIGKDILEQVLVQEVDGRKKEIMRLQYREVEAFLCRQEYRKQFKAGKIDQRTYQKALKENARVERGLQDEYERCVETLADELSCRADIRLSYDLARQILSWSLWQERARPKNSDEIDFDDALNFQNILPRPALRKQK